jgi:ribokinase
LLSTPQGTDIPGSPAILTVTVHKSAELSADDVVPFEDEIASSDVLLLQHEVPDEVNEKAIEFANKHNVKVILNPAPVRTVSSEAAKAVFAVTPNEHEAEAIDVRRFRNSIVTLGKKGCIINGKTPISSIDVKAVDTTGAGDTFNGVFAVCIAEGMDLEKACRYAVTAAGISVGRKYVLNAIPERKETEKML